MAKYNNGINGPFSGKLGTAIGSNWRGIPYMRSACKRISKPPSAKQLDSWAKFKPVARFTHKFSKLLMKYYPQVDKYSGTNQAFSDIYNSAITGSYPDYTLDYSRIYISKGALINAEHPAVVATGSGIITFNWTDNSSGSMANASDKVLLVAWCPSSNRAFIEQPGASRNAGTADIHAINYIGQELHTWITFTNAAEDVVATSIYTGAVVVH